MSPSTSHADESQFHDAIERMRAKDFDIYAYSGDVESPADYELMKLIKNNRSNKNVMLYVTTPGTDGARVQSTSGLDCHPSAPGTRPLQHAG